MTTDPALTRQVLLARLRTLELSASQDSARSRQWEEIRSSATEDLSGPTSLDQWVNQLRSELQRLGGELRTAASLNDIPSAVVDLARESRYKRIALGDDRLLEEIRLADQLNNFVEFRLLDKRSASNPKDHAGPALAQCQLGITGCQAIIAETATIVLDHQGFGGRSLSLLPECHLVLAQRSQVFGRLRDWWNATQPGRDNLPTCRTFITGPSRTADIEKVLVTGVHGPLRLVVILAG
ncbi:MAG: lactate utilization protein [Acidobacteriia bacterium]|nr:lactate utilization protein [Terriglobia bacterium]